MSKTPLNGLKTHPLSNHTITALRHIARQDTPAQEVNPGVVDRLMREDLVEIYSAMTPYRIRKGDIAWLRVTGAGRAVVDAQSKDPTP